MKLSIIIPVKPGVMPDAVRRLTALHSSIDAEVIVAEGTSPSRQRNAAAAESTGAILYFLDDDSLVSPGGLERIAAHFDDPAVAVVGGPSIPPGDAPLLQRAFAAIFTSVFGGGSVRNRYRKYGSLRRVRENELILCNLAFRKSVFLGSGGFDERLYPNEENELMDRVSAQGNLLLHDPDLAVTRSHRPSIRAFARQLFTYGRGRGEQTLVSGKVNLISLVPSAFLLYLVALPIAAQASAPTILPLFLYLFLLCLFSVAAAAEGGNFLLAPLVLVLFPLFHLTYGAGCLLGLAAPRFRRSRNNEPVRIRKFQLLQGDSPATYNVKNEIDGMNRAN